jgi:hypothetical protein
MNVIENLNQVRNEVMQLLSPGIQAEVYPLFENLENSIMGVLTKEGNNEKITDYADVNKDMAMSIMPLSAINNMKKTIEENIELQSHGLVDRVVVLNSIINMANVRKIDVRETRLYSGEKEVFKKYDIVIVYSVGHTDIIENIAMTDELVRLVNNYGLKVYNKLEEEPSIEADIPENLK